MKKATKILSLFLCMVVLLSLPVSINAGATEYSATENYEEIVGGSNNPDLLPYGTWKAGRNKVYSLTDIIPANMIKTTSGFSGGDYRYYVDSTTNNQYGAAINGPYKLADSGFKVGNNVEFKKGFGTHPKTAQTPVYINIDISAYTDAKGEYQCDTFYTCVGLTNLDSPGVYFQIYADYGDGKYKHIGNSGVITGNKLGEFNVDVAGVKTLRLVVITSTSDNSKSACAWLNPCIFKADSSASKPATPTKPDPNDDGSIKFAATDNFAEVKWSDDNRDTRPYGTWKAGKNAVISLIDTLPGEKIAQTTGQSPNYSYYIDSNTLNGFGASINGPFKKSDAGYTVGGNVSFNKGFGTHPLSGQQPAYINLDVSAYTDPNGEYKCDTFYSCVALTNTASSGVYFQVFADYGDGTFKHIANSTSIIMQNIGEFNVDITGVKTLRLAVMTSTMAHGSSASAWLNPCVFKADPDAKQPSFKEYDPSEEYEKEPIVEATLYVKSVENSGNADVGLIVGIIVGAVVAAGAACAVIVVLRKKKQSGAEE